MRTNQFEDPEIPFGEEGLFFLAAEVGPMDQTRAEQGQARTQSRFFTFDPACWNSLLHLRPRLVLNSDGGFSFVVCL